MKTVETLKAAAIILTLLFICIAAVGFFSHLRHPGEPQPERPHRPAKTMWEDSPGTR